MTDIQQSLFDEESKIERAERDGRIHKAAFRMAFNFLAAHWPTEMTQEYWEKVCRDIEAVSAENITNNLCQELLSAVLVYMSRAEKRKENG